MNREWIESRHPSSHFKAKSRYSTEKLTPKHWHFLDAPSHIQCHHEYFDFNWTATHGWTNSKTPPYLRAYSPGTSSTPGWECCRGFPARVRWHSGSTWSPGTGGNRRRTSHMTLPSLLRDHTDLVPVLQISFLLAHDHGKLQYVDIPHGVIRPNNMIHQNCCQQVANNTNWVLTSAQETHDTDRVRYITLLECRAHYENKQCRISHR